MNAKKAQTTDKSFTRPVAQKFQPFTENVHLATLQHPPFCFIVVESRRKQIIFFVSRHADSCEFHTLKLFNRFHTPRLKTTFYVI